MKGLKSIKINPNQSLFDISLQVYGHVEGIKWILEDNPGVVLTDIPKTIQIRSDLIKKETVAYLEKNKLGLTTAPGDEFRREEHKEFTNEFNFEFN